MLERMQHPPIADEVADPLIEFIVETYGYATTLALVEALGRIRKLGGGCTGGLSTFGRRVGSGVA